MCSAVFVGGTKDDVFSSYGKGGAHESERPLIENRYSPFRPTAAVRAVRGSMAGIRVEQSPGASTQGP